MAIKAIDLRRGMAVKYEDKLWVCVDNQKVAKGNWRSYQVIQLKGVMSGQLIENRFNTDFGFEEVYIERKNMEYLYSTAETHVLMDMKTFEEFPIPSDLIGDKAPFLTPNLEIMVSMVEDRPIIAELPNTVELTIKDTPPEVKGGTVTNVMKEALCEGGAKIKVPPFVHNGTKVKVDTRTGEYLGKA